MRSPTIGVRPDRETGINRRGVGRRGCAARTRVSGRVDRVRAPAARRCVDVISCLRACILGVLATKENGQLSEGEKRKQNQEILPWVGARNYLVASERLGQQSHDAWSTFSQLRPSSAEPQAHLEEAEAKRSYLIITVTWRKPHVQLAAASGSTYHFPMRIPTFRAHQQHQSVFLSFHTQPKSPSQERVTMSAQPTSKTFGKSTREVPAPSEKAKKWYPADDEPESKKVRKAVRSWTPRKSLQPGTVLILLAGRFRGKRVILLKSLDQGVLLVTGPFKINGVPLRRVNSRYVIATSYKVDISGLDESKIEEISQPKYFTAEKAKEKAGEDAFFKQGEKAQKKEINSSRAADQKAIDKALIANIKKVDLLASYLASSFSLRKGDKPHEMAW
ncbi:hypothetical protein NM208_g12135 [Fusarium decemcellulare]|uniref:Uncharacterized protein n=1 Tax=Fusarium decemcellulare TaxID=57161 RepID=A0ACC1RPU7_9HYPO|nr:hypothetical protein NM208_g12135 [Fusarium decemcellulare]